MNCPLNGLPCDHPKIIQITEDVDGKVAKFNLCSNCANSYLAQEITQNEVKKEVKQEPLKPAQILKNLINNVLNLAKTPKEEEKSQVQETPESVRTPECPDSPCPACNADFNSILKTGRLGCMRCYDHFGPKIVVALQNIHGKTKHVGKVPKKHAQEKARRAAEAERKNWTLEYCVLKLEEKLRDAVQVENYEAAARLRDEIKKFKVGLEEKQKLRESLNEVVKLENFEAAAEVKKQIDALESKYFQPIESPQPT